ncbi:hypothetical protein MMC22_008335 [Lobaria immixta]|nr:hypothetical protein [Lobaria immixta]
MAYEFGDEKSNSVYCESIEKGIRLHQQLETFDFSNVLTFGRLEDHYSLQANNLRAPDNIRTVLREWNVDTERFRYVDVRNLGDTIRSDAIYSNHFNGKDGAIVHIENDKSRDKTSTEHRLWPSEVAWQSLPDVRHCVVNEPTRNAVWQAARLSTCADQQQPDLSFRVYTALDNGFYAILGSANGAGTTRMLVDHKAEIGYRTID